MARNTAMTPAARKLAAELKAKKAAKEKEAAEKQGPGRPKASAKGSTSSTSTKTSRKVPNPQPGTTQGRVDMERDPVVDVDTDEESDDDVPMQEEPTIEENKSNDDGDEEDPATRILLKALEEREHSIEVLEHKLESERQQRIAAEVQLGELRTEMGNVDDSSDEEAASDDDIVVPTAGFVISALVYTPQSVPIAGYVEKSIEVGERDRLKHDGKYPWERVAKGHPFKDPQFVREQWIRTVASTNGDHPLNWHSILKACHVHDMRQHTNLISRYRYTGLATLDTCNDKTFANHLEIINKNIEIGLQTMQCLQALRCWVRWFRWTKGRMPYCIEFTPEQARIAWDRFTFESNLSTNKIDEATAPAKFKSFKLHQWRTFYDSVVEYISTFRGVLNIPLTYLIRPELVYTDEQIESWIASVNPSHEAVLMRTVKLNFASPEIAQDNRTLYTLLAPLVQDTDAYASVDAARRKQDGRGLWMTLIEKGEGGANRTNRHWAAQAVLTEARLDESNRGTSQQRFDNFVRILQQAFNELSSLNEPISDAEQVRIFLRQLGKSQAYLQCVSTILGSSELMATFQSATNYVSSVISVTRSHADNTTSTRKVSAVTTSTDGRLPPDEWKALTPEQRKAHLKKMKKNKTTNGGTDNKRKATTGLSRSQTKEFKRLRKIASIVHGMVSDNNANGQSAAPVRTTNSNNNNPSDQFGSRIRALESLVSNKDRSEE